MKKIIKIKEFIIILFGLKGSWKWAKKQMLKGEIIENKKYMDDLKLKISDKIQFILQSSVTPQKTIDYFNDIFINIEKIGYILGLNEIQLNNLHLCLTDILTKKTLNNEIKHHLCINLPGVLNIMSKSFNISLIEINDIKKRYKISYENICNFLKTMLDCYEVDNILKNNNFFKPNLKNYRHYNKNNFDWNNFVFSFIYENLTGYSLFNFK